MQPDLKKTLIAHAIATDARYVGRFVSTIGTGKSSLDNTASMWMIPYLSLFAYESSLKLRLLYDGRNDGPRFTEGVSRTLERSRHTLKLFEDTARGVDGQIAWYHDKVVHPSREYFIEKIKVPFLRSLGKDLGVFSYDNVPISNTHAAAFLLGVDADILFGPPEPLGDILMSTMGGYGQYFAQWGANLDPAATSFMVEMDASRFVPGRDVRSQGYYTSVFNGASTPDINALLSLFQALMNVVAMLLPLDTTEASRQTVIKLQFLTTYHVIRSLKQLALVHGSKLTDTSLATIEQIALQEMAVLATSDAAKVLRISLVHYDIHSRIELSDLAIDSLLYGLVEATLSMPVELFATRLQELASFVAGQFNNWERLGSS